MFHLYRTSAKERDEVEEEEIEAFTTDGRDPASLDRSGIAHSCAMCSTVLVYCAAQVRCRSLHRTCAAQYNSYLGHSKCPR